jgi:TolA-binding protein
VKDYLRRIQPYGKLILGGVLSLLVVSFFLIYFFVPIEEPNEMYKQATRYFDQQRYDQAQIMYQRIMERYPETMAASNASFFHALVFDRQHRVEEMIQGFQAMVTAYPESIWTPEGYYRIGLGYVQKRELEKARHFYHYVIEHFPKTVWARNARERLQEMG